MKRAALAGSLLVLLLAGTLLAQTTAPKYHQVAKYSLSGDNFWDYLTYDPPTNRLFIAHGNEILVVDSSSGKQLGTMSADGAHGIALVHDTGRGFFTNGRAGTVTVFDLKTLKLASQIKVGENPDAIIYDPYSKHVIVMNGRSHNLMAIDPHTMKVVADVPLGGKLEEAAASPGHVYVNIEDKGELASVDSMNWKLNKTWKLDGCEEPSGLAINIKADTLFSVCGNKEMVVVDAKNGKVISTVPTGAGTDGAGFDPGLNLAFASNGEGTLTVVQNKEGKYDVAENIPTQRGARTMTMDPKTHRIFTVTSEFEPPKEGQRRPSIKPGTFTLLVYAPGK